MRYIFIICLLLSIPILSQENLKTEDDSSFTFSLSGGSYTQLLQQNGNHLANLVSYSTTFHAGFKTSKFTYFKFGVDAVSTVSLEDFSYNTYQLPLLFGTDLFFGKNKENSPTKIFAEIGPYYRGISNFNDNSTVNYDTNSTLGIQVNFQIVFDINRKFYALVALRVNREFDDSFLAANDTICIQGSYAMHVGFGLKL